MRHFTSFALLLFTLFFCTPPAQACEYYRDPLGFPHIRGSNKVDAWKCFGYFHALDRSEQMSHLRKIARGESAEVEGIDAIKRDFFMRVLDLEAHAKRIASEMDPDQKSEWSAYTDGIQKARPELHWQVSDSILLLLLQSFDQTRKTFTQKIEEEKRKDAIHQWLSSLEGKRTELPWDISILKGEDLKTQPFKNQSSALNDSFISEQTGSNNWVIDKNHSATSNAWLANDPHLDLKRPAFWYWAFLRYGENEVAGASVPGTPLIASGANLNVAWGLTNAYIDVSELAYVPEKDIPNTQTHRPRIWFRLLGLQLPMFFKTYERVENSSLVLMPLPAPDGYRLVLRWRGLELKASDIKPLSQLLEVKNSNDAESTLSRVGVPGWNIVFADRLGRIGYRAIGRAFLREKETAPGVLNRSWSAIENLPILNADQMPHTLNPTRGYVVTANHKHWPDHHTFYGGRAYTPGFRGHRIEELLSQKSKLDLSDHQRIQCDNQANDAFYFVPVLLDRTKKTAPPWVAETLSSWNFSTGLDCKVCSFYRTWIDRLIQDELRANEAVTYQLLKNGFATTEVERSLRSTLEKFSEASAITPWSDFHRAFFPPLIPGTEKSDFLSTPGDKHTVNLGDGEWKNDRYNHKMGPSQRLVVELSNPPKIHLSFPGTPQENDSRGLNDPESPWKKWRECQYDEIEFPSSFDRKKLTTL